MGDISYVIYRHTCLVTGKSYVGYTKKTIEQRWNEHVSLAFDCRERSRYRKYHFQNAIKTHGVCQWTHELLQDKICSLQEACDAEIRWINELKTLSPNGYNETIGGRGVFMTDEGRERHKNATRAALARQDVRQRYLDGIRRGHSTETFILNNRIAQKIAQNKPDVIEKKRAKMKELCNKPEYTSPCARPIEQLTKDCVSVALYASAKEAARVTGVNYTKITEVARGNRKFSGGFRWRYLPLTGGSDE